LTRTELLADIAAAVALLRVAVLVSLAAEMVVPDAIPGPLMVAPTSPVGNAAVRKPALVTREVAPLAASALRATERAVSETLGIAAAVVAQAAVVKMTALSAGVSEVFAIFKWPSAPLKVFAVVVVRLSTVPGAPVPGVTVRDAAVPAELDVAVPTSVAAATVVTMRAARVDRQVAWKYLELVMEPFSSVRCVEGRHDPFTAPIGTAPNVLTSRGRGPSVGCVVRQSS
jgi:hypothetical protein